MFKATKIAEDIYWVGALEWNERYIHGFSMPKGSTNNAYLIMDEKITLIDTCMGSLSQELIDRISDVIDPADIAYIVSNHSEKDHAGALGGVIEAAPHATIVTSMPKGLAVLERYYGGDHDFFPVKSGDTLNIGKRELRFIHTPMVHWPDNMVTYSPFDKILFSNDAFGQFLATSKRFDDEVDIHEVYTCAKKYFANIVQPFAKQTSRALDAVEKLELELIAPSHGLIWRSHIPDILDMYRKWCAGEPSESAVVVYCSMYGSTERLAQAATEAFIDKGIDVRMYDLMVSDISDIITDVMEAKYLAVGSPTHNNTVLPPMGQFLTYLKGLAPKGRLGIAFGSYGWAAAGTKEIAETMQRIGYTMLGEPFTCEWDSGIADEQAFFDEVSSLI